MFQVSCLLISVPHNVFHIILNPAFPPSYAAVFAKEPDWPQLDVLLPRILYCLVQCAQIIFGLYKLNGMGLLPVYPSDWISSIKVPETLEHAFAAS